MNDLQRVKKLASMAALSSACMHNTLVNQVKAIALQTRHTYLLHLFEVAHRDVLDYEAMVVPGKTVMDAKHHEELINARTTISMEVDQVVAQLAELAANVEASSDADVKAILRLNMEIQEL